MGTQMQMPVEHGWGQGRREAVGNTFFVVTLMSPVWVLLHSLLSVWACALPYRCLAVTLLMSFAEVATSPFACSQVYKDFKNCQ